MRMGHDTLVVYTIGHSTRPLEEFIALLKAYGVTKIADVRTVPRSATNPQFNYDSLPRDLRRARSATSICPASAVCASRGLIRPTAPGATPPFGATPTTCRRPRLRIVYKTSWKWRK